LKKLYKNLNDSKFPNHLFNFAVCKLTFPVAGCLNQVPLDSYSHAFWTKFDFALITWGTPLTWPPLSPNVTVFALPSALVTHFGTRFRNRCSVLQSVRRCVEHVTSWSDVLAAKLAAITCNIGYTYLHIDAILDLAVMVL